MADWNKNNPEKKKANDRDRHLKNKYGKSMMEQFGVDGQAGYEFLLKKQNCRCALCNIHVNDTKEGYLVHDHAHDETERVRGLLCDSCNKILGGYENTMKRFGDKLQEYLGHALSI